MLRSALVIVLLGALVLAPGCGEPQATSGAGIHIGIVTGTVSQGEDEIRAAEALAKMYTGRVHHVTYPDNFMQEQETTVSQIVGLASDPRVKVIILGQAVPGSLIAVRKVKDTRPDILFGFIEPHEDPMQVNSVADFAVQPDQMARGRALVKLAKRMGAKHVIHYSFPRHMSMEFISRRRDEMVKASEQEGLEFLFVSAPDPMAEGGLPATQQFVLEDVPRQVEKHGKDTAFFSTNCGMQDPLILAVLKSGACYLEPCCPSPTHGFPTALGIEIPKEHAGDFAYINEQNRKIIAEKGMTGRLGTWPVPANYVSILAVAELLLKTAEGRANFRDPETVKKVFAEHAGASVDMEKYDESKGNYWMLLVDTIVY
jgi:hypothetical protein